MVSKECLVNDGYWLEEEFVKRKDRPFTGLCRKCNREIVKKFYRDNQDKHRVVRRRVNKRSYHKNRDKRLAQKSEYGKKNPEKRKSWAKKRMENMGVVWELNPGEWAALLNRHGRKCLKCGSTKDITKDHIIPLIDGGRHHIDNLQPLCRSCNSSKGRKTVDYRPKH